MTGFSLVMATRGRTAEVAEFLRSLEAQRRDDVELIVADQNGDDRLVPVLAAHPGRVVHLRLPRIGANHARNAGLRAAVGAILGFPDDDCLLPAGVLDRVATAFEADPALDILTGPAESPAGGLGSGRWRETGGAIDAGSVWTSVIEFNLWIRRPVALALGGFDEAMGPGTPLGSCEGNDLVLRALAAGHRARYEPGLRVIHPDKRLTEVAAARARVYGRGFGYALRRHRVPASVWLPFALRPVGGALLSLARGRMRDAGYYSMTLLGRAEGFLRGGARR